MILMKTQQCERKHTKPLALLGLTILAAPSLFAQPAPDTTRATTTIGENKVTITVSGGERIIIANGLPDHVTGRFPNRGNPNSIGEQRYRFEMPLKPHANDEPKPITRFTRGCPDSSRRLGSAGVAIINRPLISIRCTSRY